jgi:hypothetical protein
VGELQSALDGLATEDLFPLGEADLLDRTTELVRARNRIDAELSRTVRRAEAIQAPERDGLKSMKSWLRTHTRLSGGAVNRLMEAGRALASLPTAEAAFAAGEITAEQVAVIAPITSPERLQQAAEHGVDVGGVEAELVELATTVSHQRLREAVHFYVSRLDPDGAEPDPTEGRSFTMARLLEGRWHGTFELDEVGGEKVATAIESISAVSRCAGDERTAAQRRGDALVQLCDLALASGQLPTLRTIKPHVIVTIAADDLVDPNAGNHVARTGMAGLISGTKARWLACDSKVTRIVLGPDSIPVDLGREERVAPPHLRKAVVERDRNCIFAGCEAPSWWCDVHHVVEWIDDGETSLDNSALLCERHHTKVHHGFRIERDDGAPPGQRWRTFRPDGSEIILAPCLA